VRRRDISLGALAAASSEAQLACDEWIDEPVVVVSRVEYANFYHTMTDFVGAWCARLRVVPAPLGAVCTREPNCRSLRLSAPDIKLLTGADATNREFGGANSLTLNQNTGAENLEISARIYTPCARRVRDRP
jgi:hypothetical protein